MDIVQRKVKIPARYFISRPGRALDKVCNAGDGEGTCAWRAFVDRWEPRIRTRQGGLWNS